MLEHVLHSQAGLRVGLHHLPALYMLDFHVVVLAAVAISAALTLFVLWPAMRKVASTLFVVVSCLCPGFLAAYSLFLPDWMSSSAVALSPAPLGYHDWMASAPLSRRLYSRTVSLHVGLSGANVTLLAVPIEGPAGCAPPLPRTRRRHPHGHGCFPELNPRACLPTTQSFPSGLLTIRHSRAERLSRMFRGGDDFQDLPSPPLVVAPSARKLLWHEWSDEAEESYREKRSKPVHFGHRASSPRGNASAASRVVEAPVGRKTGTPTEGTRKTAVGPGRRLGPCGIVSPSVPSSGPAWFDERVDWSYGSGPGSAFRGLLRRGVPGPLLTVAEYLSRPWNYGSGGGEGAGRYAGSYDLGERLRKAGHWTSCMLNTALVLWAFSIPLQMAEPESGAKLLGVSGLFMLSAAPVYASLFAFTPYLSDIHVEGVPMTLRWGGCFYCSLLAGVWAALVGFGLAFLRHALPGALPTDLDLDEVKQRTAKATRPVVVPESEGPRSMLQFT